jgi:hypothetical protein
MTKDYQDVDCGCSQKYENAGGACGSKRCINTTPAHEDIKGGICSKCGVWKGGDYGMNGYGQQTHHTCPTPANEWREESEIAVFWDQMASFLPKSIERSALGDEKICNAFRAMYPKMKAYLLDQQSAQIVERVEGLMEQLADIEHERWSKWQAYMHSKCVEHENGKGEWVCFPAELYARWERQINTPYAELSEAEKESDREQVRPYLKLITDQAIDIVKDNK